MSKRVNHVVSSARQAVPLWPRFQTYCRLAEITFTAKMTIPLGLLHRSTNAACYDIPRTSAVVSVYSCQKTNLPCLYLMT